MASVNKVILVGNCGRDPELRYLPSGVPGVGSVRVDASDLSATEQLGNQYEDLLASLYRPFGPALFDKVLSSSPNVLKRSDCGQNKGRRVPTAHSGFSRSTSFFGSSKANKRNAP